MVRYVDPSRSDWLSCTDQSSIGSSAPATVTGTVPLELGSLWEFNTMTITITHL